MGFIYNGIGNMLSKNRKQRNISQEELSEHLKIARATLANWEKDRREPSIEMIIRICLYLGISADTLLGITNNTDQTEEILLNYFRLLNEEGQEKLLEQAEFFASSQKYIKSYESDVVQAK